jgi:UPF0755 protein
MRRATKRWLALCGAGATLCVLGAGAWLWRELSTPYRGYAGEEVFVEIRRGAPSEEIARQLTEAGVVRSRRAFALMCRVRGRRQLQAGEYRFTQALSALDVYDLIARGRVFTKPLVVPEGFTMFDIAALVEREGFAPSTAFLAAARNTAPVRDLAPTAVSLEGFLFPARYDFQRRVPAENIVAAMLRQFRAVWSRLPEPSEAVRGRSLLELVTLASLIEKETSVMEERALVAGVFTNRLRRGIALQCDPTVIYAQMLAGRWDGDLSFADMKFPSPYNTYLHPGLPPGPVASPGEAALRAALQPATTDFLYFVADGRGGHVFSRSLAEHNRNVQRYLRLLAQNRRAARPSGNKNSAPAEKPRATKKPR